MGRAALILGCLAASWPLALPSAAQPPANNLQSLQDKAIKAAVKQVAPYVVTIETSGGTDIVTSGGPRGRVQILKGTGPTTGLIVAADGYIITSAFNFANKPSSIIVQVPGQKEKFVAKSVATDQARMLTLLKIDAKNLPVPPVAPRAGIKIGHTALAIGRTLAGNTEQPPSVSQGIVSAQGRIWGKAIQTDAKVSPVNYGGPLIDLSGRVMGVLVPASPHADGETAGFEWYDSGIGFAIYLEDINRILPRLKEGKDVRPGMLGVSMKSTDMYSIEPVIATVSPGSAADGIGLKAGDIIREIAGHKVTNYAQVRHQLGSKYEGDVVSLKVERAGKMLDFPKVTLGSALAAFNQPFLGILPMRDDTVAGVLVRYVFPKSPAAAAGIKEGDRITKMGPNERALRPLKDAAALLALLATARPGAQVTLEVVPKGEKTAKKIKAQIGEYIEAVPDKLPEKASVGKPAPPKEKKKDPKGGEEAQEDEKKADEKPKEKTGLFKRTNAARDREFWVYVPEDYNPKTSYALVIWLHPVGKNKERDMEGITDRWADYCSENKIIMVCPKSENETGWVASEADFVQEAARSVINSYKIDRRRVVAHGMGVGGQMAFYLGFAARDLVRGVATTGAVLTSNPKERVPNQSVSFYIVVGEKDPIREVVKASREKLHEHRYPAVYREMKEKGHQYFDLDTEPILKELVRWIDSLDRI
jgi:serine protease Do